MVKSKIKAHLPILKESYERNKTSFDYRWVIFPDEMRNKELRNSYGRQTGSELSPVSQKEEKEMSQDQELRPCPFCGPEGDGQFLPQEHYRKTDSVEIVCAVCHRYWSGGQTKGAAIIAWNSAYCWKRISDLEAELAEQARLNGMGGSREAALLAKAGSLEKEIATLKNEARILTDNSKVNAALIEENIKLKRVVDAALVMWQSGYDQQEMEEFEKEFKALRSDGAKEGK